MSIVPDAVFTFDGPKTPAGYFVTRCPRCVWGWFSPCLPGTHPPTSLRWARSWCQRGKAGGVPCRACSTGPHYCRETLVSPIWVFQGFQEVGGGR